MRQKTTTERDKSPVEVAVPSAIPGPAQATRLCYASSWQARLPLQRARLRRSRGFTLAELLVSIGVLALLMFLATQVFKGAATVTTLGHKRMDADSQARQVLDRMAIDFAQMVKRSDVDYYVKSTAASPLRRVLQAGNDQIAFYSAVSGYYPGASNQSPVSLVAYRVNSNSSSSSYNKMERMGKGLLWNGATSGPAPIVFIPVPLSSPLPVGDLPSPTPNPLPTPAWSEAACPMSTPCPTTTWSDSEVTGSQVFRFEYYYLLKNGNFSDIPWINPHTSVSGMQDVSAIVVNIAIIDPKSKVLLTDAQLATLSTSGNANFLADYASGPPGQLRSLWQTRIDGITSLPRPALSGIRLYERYFYLSPPIQ